MKDVLLIAVGFQIGNVFAGSSHFMLSVCQMCSQENCMFFDNIQREDRNYMTHFLMLQMKLWILESTLMDKNQFPLCT